VASAFPFGEGGNMEDGIATYHRARESHCLRLAEAAANEQIASIHRELAARHRRLALKRLGEGNQPLSGDAATPRTRCV